MNDLIKKGVIILNSKDIDGNVNDGKYTRISQTGSNCVGCASYKVNANFDNINDYNNVAIIDDGSTSYPVQIDNGLYTESSLAIEVQSKLNLLGIGVWSVVYDVLNNTFSISAPVPVIFKTNVLNGRYRDYIDMMGFKKEQPLASSFVSEYYVNINYTDVLYFTSRELCRAYDKREFSTNGALNHIAVCYLNKEKK